MSVVIVGSILLTDRRLRAVVKEVWRTARSARETADPAMGSAALVRMAQ